ncbi:hypothetical protein ABBQ32_012167 [Trebouxia sp. C0010 RCD-2024]
MTQGSERSFDPLFPAEETQVSQFQSALPQYQGVMADYMARLEAGKRRAEALEMRKQHIKEATEVEASAASASIVAAAATEALSEDATASRPESGSQGMLRDYTSTLEAARGMQERRAAARVKQAKAVIPDLDLDDINRPGSASLDIELKPEVSRGVNTQLAHLARVAAELKDLAGHVGQRAEGKQLAKPEPRKTIVGIRSIRFLQEPSSSTAVQPGSQPLNLEDFSSGEDPHYKSH